MPRKVPLSDKLIGIAAVAAVGLPLTAAAQSIPERAPGDMPAMPAPQSDMPSATGNDAGAMPDMRGALPPASSGASDQTAANTPAPVDTLSAMNSDDLIGSNVRNSANEVIGKIDSLLLSKDARIVGAVIDVGGFLGLGARQVVVPMEQLSMIDADNVSLPSATKESLKAVPAYEKPRAR